MGEKCNECIRNYTNDKIQSVLSSYKIHEQFVDNKSHYKLD